MTWIRETWRQLRYRLTGARFDGDLAEEMRLHLDLRTADKQAAGMPPDVAEAAARRQFGNLTHAHENSRAAWGWTVLDSLRQDVLYGLRTMAANPGFAATAVLSLALGIGANTAIFSILNAVILRSLPVEDPQRLVQVRMGPEGDDEWSNPIWEQVRDRQQAFSGALAYAPDRFDLADGGESHYAAGLWVSGDFFRVLGVPAIEGRVFSRGEDRRGTPPQAVISYSFWKRNFAGETGVIGRTVRLNRHTFEIVGVTPPWFRGLDTDWGFDVAIPIACDPIFHPAHSALDERLQWWLRILGRMPAGESIEQARDRMRAIAPEIFRATLPQGDFPVEAQKDYLQNSFFLKPAATGFSEMGAQYRTALYTMMAIVGLVLLIACANIANLLLARATARQREFSVRMAIGAGRSRVIRQLMTESLLLAAFGSAAGLLLATWGGRLLIHLLSTTSHPLDIDLSLDARVLAFTVGAAVVTALLFGLAPAFRAARVELNQVMKENSRTALRMSGRFNLGKALVAGQVALSLVLLVAAGLFIGTLRNLWSVDPGFNRHNILIVTADAEQATVPAAQRAHTYREILDRLRALPGVTSAASSLLTPLSPEGWAQPVKPEGMSPKSPRDTLMFFNRVSPGYFATLETPLLLGRDFSDRDGMNAPKAIIVNESAARQFFGAANPIGKTIGINKDDLFQIVGVVKDTKYNRMNEQNRRIGYLAGAQDADPRPSIRFTLRSDMPVESLIPAVRGAILGVNRGISLVFRNLETQARESLLQPRIVAWLSATFGALALLLAMVGLYGITSYGVTRRKGEIAIRMALGAQRDSVVWLMLRDVVVLLALGVALGLAASLAAGRLVTSLLYGVKPHDPLQLAGAALVLAVATALAAYLPARRASRLDPMAALREE
jgi:putative ABC transport system permease protein